MYFPFDSIYPEQREMMLEVKKSLDAKGHGLIESPTGTGKTVALLSLITSYQFKNPEMGKLIYATRTVPEMIKCIEELKLIIKARGKMLNPGESNKEDSFLAVCLSSRRNMCINAEVISGGGEGTGGGDERDNVDAACRKKIAPWVRKTYGKTTTVTVNNKKAKIDRDGAVLLVNQFVDPNERDVDEEAAALLSRSNNNVEEIHQEEGCAPELCEFYENYVDNANNFSNIRGIFTLDDMQEEGKKQKCCPYFLTRRLLEIANVVVYNFSYLLDPKVANMVSKSISKNSIVIFDEAHNCDNVCIEALSVNFNRKTLDLASQNLNSLNESVEGMMRTNKKRLTEEYERLLKGLQNENVDISQEMLANPTLPEDVLTEAVPGQVRKAEQFIKMMSQIVVYLKQRMDGKFTDDVNRVQIETPSAFLFDFEKRFSIDPKILRYTHGRLDSLLHTLEVVDLDSFTPVTKVADFLTLISTPSYKTGFMLVIEPFSDSRSKFRDPIIQLACLDASIAIKPVFERFDSVIITSGTLSPIDLYPKLLNFNPVVTRSLHMSMARPCILPLVVSRGNDQTQVTSNYESKDDLNVSRNYGELLVETCKNVPDGIVCFFTAYERMERYVLEWENFGILNQVLQHKLIFIETKDIVETTLALDNYRRACDCGRGAVFLSVARGKVSEGIDFEKHYGRAVILFGVPYQYTESRILKERLTYLKARFSIPENDFLTFDAIRSASQCLGRVLRSKQDWGIMILADHRYNHPQKKKKLPGWITQFLRDENSNLSTDEAVSAMRAFLRLISQPLTDSERNGVEVIPLTKSTA